MIYNVLKRHVANGGAAEPDTPVEYNTLPCYDT